MVTQYEEKIINGVLHWRADDEQAWCPCSAQDLTRMLVEAVDDLDYANERLGVMDKALQERAASPAPAYAPNPVPPIQWPPLPAMPEKDLWPFAPGWVPPVWPGNPPPAYGPPTISLAGTKCFDPACPCHG